MAASSMLRALHPLIESKRGRKLQLPPRLTRLYGTFRVPPERRGAQVFTNFVSTLDGVVSLQTRGHSGGGDISGFSIQDRMVMGLLRATADVVLVGSGTLDADRRHVWTAEEICPPLAREFQRLRRTMGKTVSPLNVVVTASGNIDLNLPVFASGRVPAMVVTTPAGARRLGKQKPPRPVEVRTAGRSSKEIAPRAVLETITRGHPGGRILVEGGPRLLASFYDERLIDEQFLTLAPQIAGRDVDDGRLTLVMGKIFAPSHPLWGTLVDARRGDRLLFLRYTFP